MRRQGGGVIVNVSSMTSRMVLPGVGGYSPRSRAQHALQAPAESSHPTGIVCRSCTRPVTATEFHRSLAAGARVGGDSWAVKAHSAEFVAEAIVGVIGSGERRSY